MTGRDDLRGGEDNDILSGGQGNDLLLGGEGNDSYLDGGEGNDILSGGQGDDNLYGEEGNDTFVFNARTEGEDTIADFSVANDTIQVSQAGFGGGLVAGATITPAQFRISATAADASDRFIYNQTTGVLFFDVDGRGGREQVRFAVLDAGLNMTNKDIFVFGKEPIRNIDFNSDSKSDIIWRNRVTGQNAIWLMNGTKLSQNVLIPPVADRNWSIGGVGNFDGDGRTDDIIWRNRATGQNAIWLMNGTNLSQGVSTTPVADHRWSIGGVGNFDGDGRADDILWRNRVTGENTIWLMDGTNLSQGVSTTPVADLKWTIGTSSDYNGDGKSDILWRHSVTGENTIWLMDGTELSQNVLTTSVPNLNWQIGA